MKITATLSMEYSNENEAKVSFESLNPDNYEYIQSKLEEKTINFNIKSSSLGSFLLTVDDLIVCENTVENVFSLRKDIYLNKSSSLNKDDSLNKNSF